MILKPEEGKKKTDIFVPEDTNIYRVGHKLAQRILLECKNLPTPVRVVEFDYSNTPTKITLLEEFIGKSGWLKVEHVSIDSFEKEDYLLLACITNEGQVVDPDAAQRLFSLNATENQCIYSDLVMTDKLNIQLSDYKKEVLDLNSERNRNFFDVEMDKLEQWADDMKISLEKEIKDLDAEIKLRKAEAKKMLNLETKVSAQRIIKDMEKKRNEKRQLLYTAQDEIDVKKENLLTDIEKLLKQKIEQKEVFTIKWKII